MVLGLSWQTDCFHLVSALVKMVVPHMVPGREQAQNLRGAHPGAPAGFISKLETFTPICLPLTSLLFWHPL